MKSEVCGHRRAGLGFVELGRANELRFVADFARRDREAVHHRQAIEPVVAKRQQVTACWIASARTNARCPTARTRDRCGTACLPTSQASRQTCPSSRTNCCSDQRLACSASVSALCAKRNIVKSFSKPLERRWHVRAITNLHRHQRNQRDESVISCGAHQSIGSGADTPSEAQKQRVDDETANTRKSGESEQKQSNSHMLT